MEEILGNIEGAREIFKRWMHVIDYINLDESRYQCVVGLYTL